MNGTPRRWLFADQLGPHVLDEPAMQRGWRPAAMSDWFRSEARSARQP